QTARPGMQPAGVEFFDVADPGKPRSIAFFDASGPHSRGVHHLWFVDGSYLHLASGAPDFKPRNPKDDQFYRIIDVRQPTRPTEVGRWWLPGTRVGVPEPPPARPRQAAAGCVAHNKNAPPPRPARVGAASNGGGALGPDLADRAHPPFRRRWHYPPPYPGFTHTLLPLFDPQLVIV